jgi:hypothetical protein
MQCAVARELSVKVVARHGEQVKRRSSYEGVSGEVTRDRVVTEAIRCRDSPLRPAMLAAIPNWGSRSTR